MNLKNNQNKSDYRALNAVLIIVAIITFSTVIMLQKTADLVEKRSISKFITIEERLKPFGQITMANINIDEKSIIDEEIELDNIVASYSGDEVYSMACSACHNAGVAGSPKIDDAQNWEPRIQQGLDILRKHAIEGYTGKAGYMPPKGGRLDLSDQDIYNAIDYMLVQIEN